MKNKLLFVLLISFATYSLACEKEISEQLLEMEQRWNSQGSVNYTYVVKKQCFCAPDYTRTMSVSVIANEVVSANYVDTGMPVPDNIVKQLATISEWFHQILLATDNKLGEVNAVYDQTFGYPTSISIDQHKRRSDDEYTIVISELTKQ
ncbi:MAG: DUF6174 domain-containing protein [Gammaproteobacteria bacterium]